MSVLTIQLGQCGNQVGYSTLDTISKHTEYDVSPFFREGREGLTAHALLVDMEPKVISRVMQDAVRGKRWKYDSAHTVFDQGGSGNNWAHGYYIHGANARDRTMELVSHSLESMDCFNGFFLAQSVAGGTGSGLGSYLTELLKDEYSKSFLFNTVVWPHETGEVTVQDFNTILSLSSLLPASDGILVFENDILATICKSILNEKRSTLQSMNSIISHTLVSTLLPCDRLIRPDPFTYQKMRPISDPISHLCSHPGYKFVTARDIPLLPQASIEFSYHTWPGLIKHLHQMVIADSFMEERINWRINLHNAKSNSINKSLSTLLILRGRELHEADVSPFSHPAMYATNAYDPFMMAFSKLPVHNYDKCATVISNSQSIIRPLDYKLKRAFDMFTAGAYTHQYYERGIEQADFVEAFVKLEQVLKNYRNLSG